MCKLFVEDALKMLHPDAAPGSAAGADAGGQQLGFRDWPAQDDEAKLEQNAMLEAWVMNQKSYSWVHVDMGSWRSEA